MLNDIKKDAQTRMQKSVDSLKHELQRLRTGRASTALIEPLKVPYYGNDTPIMQVANVAIADARSITITPYEKTMVGPVEKAILASDLGLTPTTVGTVIECRAFDKSSTLTDFALSAAAAKAWIAA